MNDTPLMGYSVAKKILGGCGTLLGSRQESENVNYHHIDSTDTTAAWRSGRSSSLGLWTRRAARPDFTDPDHLTALGIPHIA